MSYNTDNYQEQGGARWVIGGSCDVASGGEIDIESGGALKIAGTSLSASAAELNVLNGITAGTVTASKAVVVDSSKNIGDFGNLDCTNLDAGASGTAGSIDVFPATASKGKLTISATNSTGDTTTTVTNAAMGQATTISIPDPGVSTAKFALMTNSLTTAEVEERCINVKLADVSTASSAYVVSPWTGNVTKIYSVIDGTIATADSVLTTAIGGVSITDGSLTLGYDGSAAGDVDTATPSANNAVTAGQALSVTTSGASTNTVSASMTFKIQIT